MNSKVNFVGEDIIYGTRYNIYGELVFKPYDPFVEYYYVDNIGVCNKKFYE